MKLIQSVFDAVPFNRKMVAYETNLAAFNPPAQNLWRPGTAKRGPLFGFIRGMTEPELIKYQMLKASGINLPVNPGFIILVLILQTGSEERYHPIGKATLSQGEKGNIGYLRMRAATEDEIKAIIGAYQRGEAIIEHNDISAHEFLRSFTKQIFSLPAQEF